MRFLDDRPGSAARNWMVSGSVWFASGTTVALLAAIEMAAPDFLGGIRWLVFPRIRPVHTWEVIYGFVSMTLVGAGLHYVPRLCRRPLYSERIANAAMWLWNFGLLLAIVGFLTGHTQTHEYAEAVPQASAWILLAMALIAFVTYKTMSLREEPLLYVSTWYYLGAHVWTITMFAVLGGIGWHTGVYDAIWAWFFGHNVLGLWLTPLAIGVSYYIIPRAVRQPVYSQTLTLVGFWALVAFYAHAGTHHLLQAPVPAWQKVIATVDSTVLLISVYAFLANIWLTMRGKLWRVEQSLALKFAFVGTLWYFAVSTQGSLQSLMAVHRYEHFTNWVVAHAHIGILGFAGFLAVGALYDVLPAVTDSEAVYSARLANFQYWLMLFGITSFFLILTTAGLIQGNSWLNGESIYRVVPMMHPYMVWRALTGTFLVVASYIQLYNVLMTVRGRQPVREHLEPAVGVTPEHTGVEGG